MYCDNSTVMRKLLFTLFAIIAFTGVNAQASLGFANNTTPGLSDTLIKNSTITYGVYVKNTGTQPLNTPYWVIVGVLDSALNYTNVDSVIVNNNNLQPGDTNNVLIIHNVDPQKFMDGGNTVVIWPEAPGYTTTDTIYKYVVVIDFNDLEELSDYLLDIYPNPVKDLIYIRTDLQLESVRILDLNGREVLRTKNNVIDLSSLESSIYLIEIKDEKGKMVRRKIMVE